MTATDFDIAASWAIKPTFYRAPVPPEPLANGMKSMDFQHAGVEYCIARDHALLGDAPGLTKTAQSVMIDNAIGSGRTLVVSPASLRLNWEREIWNWSTRPNVHTYPVFKSSDGVNPDADFVILSYALLANNSIFRALMDLRWDHLILDEAHALKDPKGNTRTKAICAEDGLRSVVGRITMASGTILPNQPIECYNAVRLLNWEAINQASLDDFRDYYYDKGGGMVRGKVFDPKRNVWVANKLHYSTEVRNMPRHEEDLQRRLRKHVMVRRLKEDVLKELPPKVWHPFPLMITPEMRAALKHPGWSEVARLYEMDPEAFQHGIPIDGEYATARRLLGEAKAEPVADYIDDLIDGGVRKVVVGAFHRSVLDTLRSKLQHHGLVYMDGGTSAVKRQAAVDQFQMSDKITVMLGQTNVLGEGWTLTQAQDAVLAEPDPVPGKNDQFLDRIHRMGQKGNYLIGHIPMVPGTLDERLLSIAVRKDRSIYKALDKRSAA